MNRFLLYVFIVLSFGVLPVNQLSAQNRMYGVVHDSLSGNPVAYASVGILGTNKGTITNEEGAFVIAYDTLPVLIAVHEVGYTSRRILITHDHPVILLSSSVYQLKEAVIDADKALNIFKHSLRKLQSTENRVHQSDAFFRLITKTDDTCTEMIENFYNTGLSYTGIRSCELEHGRYAYTKVKRDRLFPQSLDFSQIVRHLDILNKPQTRKINYMPFVFDDRYLNFVWFTMGKNIGGEDHLVRIDFEPKSKFKNKIFTTGSIYINAETYTVYKVIQRWNKWGETPLIRSTDNNTTIDNFNMEFEISFEPDTENKMVMKHIRMNMNYNLIDRLMKIKSRKVNTYADMIFYNFRDETQSAGIPFEENEYAYDYYMIRHRLYIRRFWDNNPILAETPYEKRVREDFEKSGSFGKVFNNSNDSLDLLNEGYLPWSSKRKVHLEDLASVELNPARSERLSLKVEGQPIAGLCGELFFAWNCYRDTFYYVVFPLMDLNSSWILPDEVGSSQSGFLFEKYHDLLELHKRILIKKLKAIRNPCSDKKNIMKVYQSVVDDFNYMSRKLVLDCWNRNTLDPSRAYKWNRLIEDKLKAAELK